MEYYNPIDHSTKRYAALVTIAVMAIGAALLSFIEIEVERRLLEEPPLEVVFELEDVEQDKPVVEQSAPTDVRRDKAPAHVTESPVEQSQQTSGTQENTQTINPNALFGHVAGNSQEVVPEGNRLAADGDENMHRGDQGGYNLQGSDQLDAGLQGRGLREGLPKPSTQFNKAGRVVVSVTVDSDGNVVSAKVDLAGTTTSDETLHRLAVEAALKAKFRPSSRTSQGGRITYDFKLQ